MQRRHALSLLGGLSLAGCGFRLRGSERLPRYPLLVRGQVGATAMALIARLRDGDQSVWLSGDPQAPAVVEHVLVILQDDRQRVVQGSNASGLVRELNLQLRFRWTLLDDQSQEIIAPQDMMVDQDMSYNESAALGKSEEENALFQVLQDRVVRNTISRLSRVKP